MWKSKEKKRIRSEGAWPVRGKQCWMWKYSKYELRNYVQHREENSGEHSKKCKDCGDWLAPANTQLWPHSNPESGVDKKRKALYSKYFLLQIQKTVYPTLYMQINGNYYACYTGQLGSGQTANVVHNASKSMHQNHGRETFGSRKKVSVTISWTISENRKFHLWPVNSKFFQLLQVT